MSPATLYGLVAWAILAGAAAGSLVRRRQLPVAAGAAILALIPAFAGESLAMGLHGALAAPSFTLLQLALLYSLAPGRQEWLGRGAAAILAGGALVFYPLALGLGPFDPYGLGYRALPVLAGLLPLGAWLAWRRHQAWLAILGCDLLAYAAGLFGNLWDALFDPALVLLAVASLTLSRRLPGRSAA